MLRKGIFVLLALMLSTAVHAQQFTEGKEYTLINTPVKTSDPDKVVVTEMFWYGCPHCFRLEPYLVKWEKSLGPDVVFEQLPSVLNPHWMEHARAYYALKAMGELGKVHQALFNAIHLKRKRLNSLDKLAEFVAGLGVDEKKFRENYHSFPVDTQIRKSKQKERKYGHRGVPAIIINGKYLTGASMAGSNAALLKVMDFLVQKELAANKK